MDWAALPESMVDTPVAPESTRTPRTEHCGNCAAEVPASADICPRCGALLAAYRNPLDAADDFVLTVVPVGTPVDPALSKPARPVPALAPPIEPVEFAAVAESPAPIVSVPAGEPGLREARERLLRTLLAPERRVLETLPVYAPVQPARVTTSPPAARTEPLAIPATNPAPRRVVAVLPPVPVVVPEPRKPGFMVKGSVPVVLLWGLGLILASCVVFVIASTAAGSRFGTAAGVVGLLLGVVGAICVVFAMLVHLVRREADR